MSGQQTSSLFSSGFMVGQYEEDTINDNVESKSDTHGYDMVGNAQLNSVVEVNSLSIGSSPKWNRPQRYYILIIKSILLFELIDIYVLSESRSRALFS